MSTKIAVLLDQPDPWPALVTEYPELATLPAGATSGAIRQLYATYCAEWEGLNWSSLVTCAA